MAIKFDDERKKNLPFKTTKRQQMLKETNEFRNLRYKLVECPLFLLYSILLLLFALIGKKVNNYRQFR